MPRPASRSGVDMYQKHQQPSPAVLRTSNSRTLTESDVDTEFEDTSDFDDYQGRNSEESVGFVTLFPR